MDVSWHEVGGDGVSDGHDGFLGVSEMDARNQRCCFHIRWLEMRNPNRQALGWLG